MILPVKGEGAITAISGEQFLARYAGLLIGIGIGIGIDPDPDTDPDTDTDQTEKKSEKKSIGAR